MLIKYGLADTIKHLVSYFNGAAHQRRAFRTLDNALEEVIVGVLEFIGLHHSTSEISHGLRSLSTFQCFIASI